MDDQGLSCGGPLAASPLNGWWINGTDVAQTRYLVVATEERAGEVFVDVAFTPLHPTADPDIGGRRFVRVNVGRPIS